MPDLDSRVESFFVGAYTAVYIARDMYTPTQLAALALYASRWTSFALNMLVTLFIAYRAWKFKNVLKNCGLTIRESAVYRILARLIETGVLLLAVQLLVAILATTYTSVDPSDPGFVAMNATADLGLMVISAHPAAMSIISTDILSKEAQDSRNMESQSVSSKLAFRVTETQLSAELPRSVGPSVHTEKENIT
ncbi:hypothetical protein DL96DRAFT_1685510 [Flagelloscypha sp. PMI_526]|nr:hypothetical protein DL96DRAFT_1685510 [Flagelloscypha sp. PMI_526]